MAKKCTKGKRDHKHIGKGTMNGRIRDLIEVDGHTYVDDGSICSEVVTPQEPYIPSHWSGRKQT